VRAAETQNPGIVRQSFIIHPTVKGFDCLQLPVCGIAASPSLMQVDEKGTNADVVNLGSL